jgi:XTP/dITP diphosphohydrolase
LDGVPAGQPALALAQKVLGRVGDAGLPADLIPAGLTTVAVTSDIDVENNLRTEILEFMDAVRTAEKAIAATRRGDEVPEELDVAVLDSITEAEWLAAWPIPIAARPTPDGIPEPHPAEVPEPEERVREPSPEAEGEAEEEPLAANTDEHVIEEEFPAAQMPAISDLEAAANGVDAESGTETSAELEPTAPSDSQPNSVERS